MGCEQAKGAKPVVESGGAGCGYPIGSGREMPMDCADELGREDQRRAENRDASLQSGGIIFAEACHIQQNAKTIADYTADRTSSRGANHDDLKLSAEYRLKQLH
jgi:hypothetical protein